LPPNIKARDLAGCKFFFIKNGERKGRRENRFTQPCLKKKTPILSLSSLPPEFNLRDFLLQNSILRSYKNLKLLKIACLPASSKKFQPAAGFEPASPP
jgi:hypothetical protein